MIRMAMQDLGALIPMFPVIRFVELRKPCLCVSELQLWAGRKLLCLFYARSELMFGDAGF